MTFFQRYRNNRVFSFVFDDEGYLCRISVEDFYPGE